MQLRIWTPSFISGNDLGVDELREFRDRFAGLIFCDYHSLALGRDDSGKRFFRRNPEYGKYLAPAKIVQMNIAELATISGIEQLSFGNIIAVCSLIHGLGPEICVITLGGNGAVLSLDGGKSAYHLPPISVANEIDPTGCGDTFAAVFLYNYLISGDALKSAATANRYAAAKTTFTGIDGFAGIESILQDLGPDMDPVKLK
jgi:sugar/nucleoside kinase (ribokinase family)